jgi:hypothetical protein
MLRSLKVRKYQNQDHAQDHAAVTGQSPEGAFPVVFLHDGIHFVLGGLNKFILMTLLFGHGIHLLF